MSKKPKGMTVADLIKELQGYPQDATVFLQDNKTWHTYLLGTSEASVINVPWDGHMNDEYPKQVVLMANAAARITDQPKEAT